MGLQTKSLVSIGKEMLLEVSLFEILSERNISDSKYLRFSRECAAAPERVRRLRLSRHLFKFSFRFFHCSFKNSTQKQKILFKA